MRNGDWVVVLRGNYAGEQGKIEKANYTAVRIRLTSGSTVYLPEKDLRLTEQRPTQTEWSNA